METKQEHFIYPEFEITIIHTDPGLWSFVFLTDKLNAIVNI